MAEVTLKLTIGSFAVEVTGPEEYANRKLEELVGRYLTSSRPTADASSTRTPVETPGKQISAAEFLKKVAHHNQTDRAIALGYFLEYLKGQSGFTTTEVGELGRQTKQPFSNISDAVARLVARGLMMSAGEKEGQRAYALTASGEEYVESMSSK